MYRHKSSALKGKERAEKESKTLAQQRSLLSLGFISQPPNGRSCTADQKPTEDQNCVQNTSDWDNPSIDDSTFTAPTESDTGATAVLDLPLAVDIIRELFTITDSIAVKDNDISHLADFLTTEQAEVAVRRGPDKHPYQFPCDHSKQKWLCVEAQTNIHINFHAIILVTHSHFQCFMPNFKMAKLHLEIG